MIVRRVPWTSCSICSCRGAASSAARPASTSAPAASRALPRLASAALRALRRARPPGRSRRCTECAAAGSPSPPRGRRWPTTTRVRALVAGWKEHGLRRLARARRRPGRGACRAAGARQLLVAGAARPRPRRSERGHHPAAALARELGASLGAAGRAARSRRARPAPRQRGLPLAERRRNVAGAFAAGRVAAARRPRGRRLHDRRDRRRGRLGAPAGRARDGPRRDVRPGGARVYSLTCRPTPARRGGASMRLQVKGKNLEVSDSIRSYAEAEARQARPAAARADAGRARAHGGAQPVDRGEPGRRGDDLDEGARRSARARRRADMRASIDQLDREAGAAGQALPRRSAAAGPARNGASAPGGAPVSLR